MISFRTPPVPFVRGFPTAAAAAAGVKVDGRMSELLQNQFRFIPLRLIWPERPE
jgi:hypothetical protein